ncbi:MAG TPA: hypothetical protein VN878_06630 [Usitatibacter sp.]|nr:hypothetical protein [Usitatibacter sp.]
MHARILLTFLLLCLGFFASFVQAAASVQALTPLYVSIPGGESRVFSVRFLDPLGRPAANEMVQFGNDACGNFENGLFNMSVATNADGVASARFTAFDQGIACWVIASAGAQVRFDVLTYRPANVVLSAATEPPQRRPGQPFMLLVTAWSGASRLSDIDIRARVLPGSASASLAPALANTGQHGSAAFALTPDGRLGDYEIELQFRDRLEHVSMRSPPTPWQDLWWSGISENGWGMSVVQHRDMLFAVIYAYDAAGKPTWYVMPGGQWNEAHSAFSGVLYVPRGSPYYAYDAAHFVVPPPIGSATLTFSDLNNVVLDYAIGGVSGRKAITRQAFGPADVTQPPGIGDMWWGGSTQNGWGIAVLQQYRSLFSVWFTYDENGAPTWFAMPSGSWSDAKTWEGRLYRSTGSPWLGSSYDPAALRVFDVGRFRMRFDTDSATFDYVIEGRAGTIALTRQSF